MQSLNNGLIQAPARAGAGPGGAEGAGSDTQLHWHITMSHCELQPGSNSRAIYENTFSRV